MTGEAFAARLERSGLATDECEAKARLFETAAAGLSVAARDAHCATWVPGRLELFGKHTDYAGGRSLLAALPRGFVFVSVPRRDDEVRVIDAASGQSIRVGDALGARGWPRYAGVVVSRLSRNFPGATGGMTLSFASDLPPAAGMSSSSALVVGIAHAIIHHWRLSERSDWRAQIDGPLALAEYLSSIENGSGYRYLHGDAGVGTRGGSEDHVAMLLCHPNCFSECSFMPVNHLRDVMLPSAWSVVVASSGVSAEKAGGAREVYNQLAEATRALLRLWNQCEPHAVSLSAALASSAEAPDRLKSLVHRHAIDGWQPQALIRRLEHLQLENQLVSEASNAIREVNDEAIGVAAGRSQQAAEELLGQQTAETIALASEARAAGALAACSFGAGFGGSVWALVPRRCAAELKQEWLARYLRRFPDRDAQGFLAPPGPALVELPLR